MIKFNLSNFTIDAAGPDGLPRRTITGVAVEYNTYATVSDGTRIQFAPGSLPAYAHHALSRRQNLHNIFGW